MPSTALLLPLLLLPLLLLPLLLLPLLLLPLLLLLLLLLLCDLCWPLRSVTPPLKPHVALWHSHTADPSSLKLRAKQSSWLLPPWHWGHRVLCWPKRGSGSRMSRSASSS
jgi:hypothetical protein